MRKLLLLAVLATFGATSSSAQYYDSRVLDKSFENSDFFFTPLWLNPYGLEGFGQVVPGLVSDPLLDLQLSPSLARADSGKAYLYLDFRNTREQSRGYDYHPYYDRALAVDDAAGVASDASFASQDAAYLWYPSYYMSAYRPAQPILSAAAILQPGVPGLTLGLTYSAVTDNQDYYSVPQDIYRSEPGLDFAGTRAVGESVPITDIYAGTDQMHQLGHFPTLFGSYALKGGWTVGARASFAVFDRDGELGDSRNQPASSYQSVSTWSQFETRSQNYRHRDISLGIDGLVTPETRVGASLGMLSGDADQNQIRGTRYEYRWNDPGNATYSYRSDYTAGSDMDGAWDRSGESLYGTLFARHRLGADQVLSVSWRGMRQSVDMTSWSAVADSSYSLSDNEGPDYAYYYEHRSDLVDSRTAVGDRSGHSHRVALGLDWTLTPRTRLVLGLVGNQSRVTTITSEDVDSHRYRYYDNRWQNGSEQFEEEITEDKTLEWHLSSRQTTLRLPVMIWHDFNEHFQLLAGVTREMEDWRISDQTLAVFDLRSVERNGELEVRRDFGERYREPTEYRTAVSTTALFGLTARPSEHFDVRLLVSPKWAPDHAPRRTQWWLGFQFRP